MDHSHHAVTQHSSEDQHEHGDHKAHDKHAGHHTHDFLKRFWIRQRPRR